MKKIILAMLVLMLVFTVGCGEKKNTLKQIEDEGTLTIGVTADYMPFEYINKDGDIVGFDVDIANAIATKLGVEVKFIDTAFDGLIPGLKSDKYDLIISAMTITEKREKAVDFTEPYFNAGQVIAVMKEDNNIKNLKDLAGKKVGVQLGTTGDLKASEMNDLAKVKRYEKVPQAYLDLRNGRVDAIINDLPVTAAYIMKHPEVKIVGEPFTSEYYGIAARPGDDQLLKKINTALKEIKTSGTYDEIYNKWFK